MGDDFQGFNRLVDGRPRGVDSSADSNDVAGAQTLGRIRQYAVDDVTARGVFDDKRNVGGCRRNRDFGGHVERGVKRRIAFGVERQPGAVGHARRIGCSRKEHCAEGKNGNKCA